MKTERNKKQEMRFRSKRQKFNSTDMDIWIKRGRKFHRRSDVILKRTRKQI